MALTAVLLSGSTQGKPIKVVATTIGTASGTVIHATGTSASIYDAITLWAWNTDTTTRLLTLGWGVDGVSGYSDPDDLIEIPIPPSSSDRPTPVLIGHRVVGGGAAALTLKAMGAAANVICVYGEVDRYA